MAAIFILRFQQHRQQIAFVRSTRTTLSNDAKHNCVDLTDVATYLGKKYGGWFPTAEKYGTKDGRWIGLPLGASGALVNYRVSWMKEAGFEQFPTDTVGFLKLCQGLKKIGHPPGFALSHATGDSETWMHNMLWGFGGKLVDNDAQGKLQMDAPTPRTADGKPDLSGMWMRAESGPPRAGRGAALQARG